MKGGVKTLKHSKILFNRNKNPRLFFIESPWIFVYYANFTTALYYAFINIRLLFSFVFDSKFRGGHADGELENSVEI